MTPKDIDLSEKLNSNSDNLYTHPDKQMSSKRYNEDFIKILGELTTLMTKQGEIFRARAYKTAQNAIMQFPDSIYSPDKQLKNIPGIGSTILTKLNEFIETGTLSILEREKTNPLNLFTDIYGVGPKKAKELVDMGISTIDELRQHKNQLNDKQQIGLEYYEDLIKRIPRKEIDDFKEMFELAFNEVAPHGSTFEIVGSYRRGALSSGDIDIIITNSNDNSEIIKLIVSIFYKQHMFLWKKHTVDLKMSLIKHL